MNKYVCIKDFMLVDKITIKEGNIVKIVEKGSWLEFINPDVLINIKNRNIDIKDYFEPYLEFIKRRRDEKIDLLLSDGDDCL